MEDEVKGPSLLGLDLIWWRFKLVLGSGAGIKIAGLPGHLKVGGTFAKRCLLGFGEILSLVRSIALDAHRVHGAELLSAGRIADS
ncbi:hypothetical protein CEXT_640541 [Caerostris extrusa]|uniref:Uncharacterized protein n=1 Tax=Caerostris extrusa TaxID=172846 RepID=A0AAV4X0H6_CAEEX|nr:hypothetical protein CEXT_640541 [Caerostris extrusa]